MGDGAGGTQAEELETFWGGGGGAEGAVGVEAGEGDDFVILDFAGFWMEKVGEEGDGVTGGAVEAVEGGQRFASGVVGAIAEDPEAAGGIDGRTVGAGGVAGGAVGTVPLSLVVGAGVDEGGI
jgi:hypothetical protein